MLSVTQLVAALISLFVLTSCVAQAPPVVLAPSPTRDVPEAAAEKIHRYVAEHKGWRRSLYHLERYPDDDSFAVFAVVYRRDESGPPSIGGGKSFALYCDARSYKIVREMWFQ